MTRSPQREHTFLRSAECSQSHPGTASQICPSPPPSPQAGPSRSKGPSPLHRTHLSPSFLPSETAPLSPPQPHRPRSLPAAPHQVGSGQRLGSGQRPLLTRQPGSGRGEGLGTCQETPSSPPSPAGTWAGIPVGTGRAISPEACVSLTSVLKGQRLLGCSRAGGGVGSAHAWGSGAELRE